VLASTPSDSVHLSLQTVPSTTCAVFIPVIEFVTISNIREEENKVETVEIMIVDDLKEWRLRLRRFLELIPGFRVVAEAADGLEAFEKAAQLFPDIVLLDIGMPILNGIEAAPRIRRASPQSGIIFLTQEDDSDIRAAALATGATAYLLKSTPVSELRHTIEKSLLHRFQECDAAMVIPYAAGSSARLR
jgi:DNA-binding NarL/FixJ family response regulator